jgi:hypothetical protein
MYRMNFGELITLQKALEYVPVLHSALLPRCRKLIILYECRYINPVAFLLKLFYMHSELQEERDNARDMIEEAYQSYRSVSLLTLT